MIQMTGDRIRTSDPAIDVITLAGWGERDSGGDIVVGQTADLVGVEITESDSRFVVPEDARNEIGKAAVDREVAEGSFALSDVDQEIVDRDHLQTVE